MIARNRAFAGAPVHAAIVRSEAAGGVDLDSRRWGRVREVREQFGFSKPWVFARLKSGAIRAKRIDGVLLVDLDSVRKLIESSPDWTP